MESSIELSKENLRKKIDLLRMKESIRGELPAEMDRCHTCGKDIKEGFYCSKARVRWCFECHKKVDLTKCEGLSPGLAYNRDTILKSQKAKNNTTHIHELFRNR